MAKTILCTIDFSPSSCQALKLAATLARDLKAHLTILYTYRLIRVRNEELFDSKKKIEEEAAKNFISLEKEFLMDMDISYDFKTEIGFVADRVEAYSKKTPIGFFVIDKKMSFDSKETFNELLENMKVPILIVP